MGARWQPPALNLLGCRLVPCCSPVFNELGEVVGIAFQSYAGSDAENIGYVIPTPGTCACLWVPARCVVAACARAFCVVVAACLQEHSVLGQRACKRPAMTVCPPLLHRVPTGRLVCPMCLPPFQLQSSPPPFQLLHLQSSPTSWTTTAPTAPSPASPPWACSGSAWRAAR